MATNPRATITLTPPIAAAIDGLDISLVDYLERVLEAHERRWRAAHMALRSAGWSRNALYAAMEALNGYAMIAQMGRGHGSQGVALELHDAQRIGDLCGKHDVDPEEWHRLVEGIRGSHELAGRLIDLAEAFWMHTPGLERVLSKEPA